MQATGQGPSDGSVNNKRLNGGWISEQLKDRWMDQGALDEATDCSFCRVVMFILIY